MKLNDLAIKVVAWILSVWMLLMIYSIAIASTTTDVGAAGFLTLLQTLGFPPWSIVMAWIGVRIVSALNGIFSQLKTLISDIDHRLAAIEGECHAKCIPPTQNNTNRTPP